MFAGLNGWHLLILLAVILLLFGAAKLPALAKSMGQSARVFKGEMSALKEEDAARAEQREADKDDKGEGSTGTGQGTSSDPERPR
ncbi:twin-arginine translocase TatA/TatE family subunit [Streptomyces sp. MS2A]|uniref:twin-arginine translocase TatA/TatE family subunit n=1 Tax=Microbacterium resistens TaxID=156977 RepID=UPI00082EE224|nr:twin-arginine translocase TatA/TatE family subunit [Microbacterium resistens]MDA4894921.1 twin-arginine translocase TatA/TatE family subunit [Streptomyces sp. MS2A]